MRRAGDEAERPLTGRRRLLRYGAAALLALAFVYGARAWQAASREVTFVYHAPAGVLRVTLTDARGERLRTSEFHGADRAHTIRLAEGTYDVELDVEAAGTRVRAVEVSDQPTIEVRW